MEIQNIEFSVWKNDTIDQLVLNELVSNDDKIKLLGEYISWKLLTNSTNTTNTTNSTTYPVINLLAGYYGLVTSSSSEQIKQMMSKAYGIEFTNSINKLTNLDIISGLLVLNNMYVLLNNTKLPNF